MTAYNFNMLITKGATVYAKWIKNTSSSSNIIIEKAVKMSDIIGSSPDKFAPVPVLGTNKNYKIEMDIRGLDMKAGTKIALIYHYQNGANVHNVTGCYI